MKYAVFDVETTGLGSSDEVIQFAAVITNEDFKAVETVNFYCYTQHPISDGAYKTHGIDKGSLYKLSGGKAFEDRIKDYPQLFKEKDLIWVEYSTNRFDQRLINQTLKNNGHPPIEFGSSIARLGKTKGIWSFSLCNALAALKFGGKARKLTQAVSLLPYPPGAVDRMYLKYIADNDGIPGAFHNGEYDAFVTWLLLFHFRNEFMA